MDEVWNRQLTVGLLITAGVVVLSAGIYSFFGKKKVYKRVGSVAKLYIHPIKSCPGIEVESGELTPLGLKSRGVYDRSWLLVNEKNAFQTLRQCPKLALITVAVSEDRTQLVLTAPDQPEIRVPVQADKTSVVESRVWGVGVQGYDCGDEVANWFSSFLGGTYRLMHFRDDLTAKDVKDDTKFGYHAKDGEKSIYQDYAHINILSDSSIEDLNSRLTKPVTSRNFRPNILATECTQAFAEDSWRNVKIGDDVELRFTHYCGRCKLTTVNLEKGEFDSLEPLRTLKEYRQSYDDDPDKKSRATSPIFGVNLMTEKYGTIKVGDSIYASY